jgi:DNA-binding XRE family transcriptional regulator
MKLPINYLRGLFDNGYSVITIGDNKTPNIKWKETQTKPLTKDEFEKCYNLETTKGQGLVTGYNGLEVVDVDLKVIPTASKQAKFWLEYLTLLQDNIQDFDDKFVIYKTINNGFHILYRCEEIEGNKKIAKLQGHSEAIIETRGVGGYVFIYEKQVSNLGYYDVKTISKLDREILLSISKMFDEPKDLEPEINTPKDYIEQGLTPSQDFNQRNDIWSVISDEFTIVKRLSNKTIIKRLGATSDHSGYIFNDSGCMYLFTTGTHYPNEKLITPFSAYTYRHFNGDFKESYKKAYADGYGDRLKVITPEKLQKEVIEKYHFPLEIFPIEYQNYINESAKVLNLSIDYMGSSLLWLYSVMIGNSAIVKVKNGWNEPCNLWLAMVGDAGIGKTPSISHIIRPLENINRKEQKLYKKKLDAYNEFQQLSKDEKKQTEEIKKPRNKQFIVGDVTLEALVDLHEENPNAVGIFKDELAGWFKDMNKYRAGSDLEFWLSSWSNKSYSLNRKTSKNAFVDKPFIPVLGGIQPTILEEFSIGDNKENGFIDRVLMVYPELQVDYFNESFLDAESIDFYENSIQSFHNFWQNKFVKFDENDEQIQQVATFSEDAKREYSVLFNKITDIQNGDFENEYMKSMYPKQKSYIPRFALIINVIDSQFSENLPFEISGLSMQKAGILSDYFVNTAKQIKINAKETKELFEDSNPFEKFKQIYAKDPDFNRSKVAKILEVSRKTIINWIKKLENNA